MVPHSSSFIIKRMQSNRRAADTFRFKHCENGYGSQAIKTVQTLQRFIYRAHHGLLLRASLPESEF